MSEDSSGEQKGRILIVDDSPADLRLLMDMLTEHGYAVQPASDGERAVRFVRSTPPDLVLLDIIMPGMDGYEVCERLKADERTRDIPIIVITALAETRDKVHGFKLGAVDCVTKPFQVEEVLVRVETHLALHAMHKRLEGQNAQLQKDITRRKQAEEALRLSEEKYRALVENINDVIFALDAQGCFTYVSPAIERFAFYTTNEVLGQPFTRFVHPDDLPGLQASFGQTRAGILAPYEFRIFAQDGAVLYVKTSSRPLWEGDQLAGLTGVIIDITERKRAEEALREAHAELERRVAERTAELAHANAGLKAEIAERQRAEEELKRNEERYALAQKVANIGSWDWDIQTGSLYWSEQIEPMFGFGHGEFGATYEAFLDCVHPQDRQYVVDSVTACIKHGANYDIKHRIVWPDGTARWVAETGNVFRDRVGTAVRMLGIVEDITEQKRAEEPQRESEERYRSLFDGVPVGLYRTTPAGQILDANPAFVHMLGYPDRQTLLAVNITADLYVDSEVRKRWQAMMERERVVRDFEVQVRRFDGTVIWAKDTGRAVQDTDGRVLYYEGSLEDITERKRAEEELFSSRQMLQLVLDNIPQRIFWKDRNSVYLGCNRPLAQDCGYADPSDLVGKTDYETASAATADVYRADDRQVMETGVPKLNYEEPQIKPDGSPAWLRTSKVPLRDKEGRVIAVLGTYEDITERKQAEEALRRYAQRLENMQRIDHAILAAQSAEEVARAALSHLSPLIPYRQANVVRFDFEKGVAHIIAETGGGTVESAPERIIPIDDLSALDILGQGPTRYVEDIAAVERRPPILERLLATGVRSFVSAPLFVGGDLIGEINFDATQPAAFEPEHRDIAREVADQLAVALQHAHLREELQHYTLELEQRVVVRTRELAEANERLTELDRLKSKFVSDVSHELRTPITNLRLYLGLLERGKPEKFEEYVAVLNKQADRLIRLIEDILDLSRLEAAQATLTFAPTDVNAIVEQVVTAHRPRAEAAQLDLRFDFDPDLPWVQAAPDQLSRVVTNLVANAINYTQAGEVRVSTYRKEGRVCLDVRDTGIGIGPKDMPHLFERFYRGRQSSPLDIPGTGLGLAIVKEIVELHGGSVEVESRLGEGSTFRVWLPVSTGEHQHTPRG